MNVNSRTFRYGTIESTDIVNPLIINHTLACNARDLLCEKSQ